MGVNDHHPNEKAWEIHQDEQFTAVFHHQKLVGLITPSYAEKLIKLLNTEESAANALRLACEELLPVNQRSPENIRVLMGEFIKKTRRPKAGPLAVAMLLQERQKSLDLTNQEFLRFCDSYKLPPAQLKSIYTGKEVPFDWLPALARILGISSDAVMNVITGELPDPDLELE